MIGVDIFKLLLSSTILIGLVAGQCSQPKSFNACASACEPTCGSQPSLCTLQCVEDCVCPSELVRQNDSCVLPSNCQGADCPSGVARFSCFAAPCLTARCPRHTDAICIDDYCGGCNARFFKNAKEVTNDCQCSQPKSFSACASACEPTCGSQPSICTLQCVEDCVCPSELVRQNDSCVLPSNCPGADCPSGLTRFSCLAASCLTAKCPRHTDAICIDDYCGGCNARFFKNAEEVTNDCNCTAPKKFQTCGSACPATCDEPNPICTEQCVERCGCPDGMVEKSSTNSTCIPASECADNCEAPRIFSTCASACPPNCNDLERPCVKKCVQKCACPQGMVEVSSTNNTCIVQESCPGSNQTTVIVGVGVGVVAALSVLAAVCLKMRS